LNFTTVVIQVGYTFKHEPYRVAEQKILCFEFLVLVNLASILFLTLMSLNWHSFSAIWALTPMRMSCKI
jgi:hypothetical protein